MSKESEREVLEVAELVVVEGQQQIDAGTVIGAASADQPHLFAPEKKSAAGSMGHAGGQMTFGSRRGTLRDCRGRVCRSSTSSIRSLHTTIIHIQLHE